MHRAAIVHTQYNVVYNYLNESTEGLFWESMKSKGLLGKFTKYKSKKCHLKPMHA